MYDTLKSMGDGQQKRKSPFIQVENILSQTDEVEPSSTDPKSSLSHVHHFSCTHNRQSR